MLYNGLNIIVDAFEKRVFEYGGRPRTDVDYETFSDTYDLSDKELQMFKKFVKYNSPNKKNIMSLKIILKLSKMF